MADSPPPRIEIPAGATVLELVRAGAVAFERAGLCYGHGMDDAIDESAALVFHALGLEHAASESAYGLRPGAADVDRVARLLERRIERRVPAAYLMGRMWFAGMEFEVDERVIVPRSPFAELILAGFEPWLQAGQVRRVLDVGTGSGCIAIACARYLEGVTVDAVDLSPAALEVARCNVSKHGMEDRVRLLQGDVFAPVGGLRYDLIVANPPYVSDSEMAALPAEYRHEPDLALRSGTDGLDVTRRILSGAEQHLEKGGALFVEVGDSEDRLQQAFPTVPFLWLEFEHGGGGVFMLTREDLARHRHALQGRA